METRKGLVRETAHFDRPVTPLFASTVLPALERGHRAASLTQGGGGALHLETVDGWVYASWAPLDAAPPADDAPDVFQLVESWERERIPRVRETLARMRGLARPGSPARRVAAELDGLQRDLEELMRLHYDTGFAAQGAGATLGSLLAARGDPSPALSVETLLAPSGGLLRDLDAWVAECSAAPDPLGAALASPLWGLARERPARLDLDAPTWGEDVAPLRRALRLADHAMHRAGEARALAARAAAQEGVLARFPQEAHGSVGAVLDALRRARAARQSVNFLVGEVAVGLTRLAWLRAGAALAAVGVLGEAEDVVWLARDEARAALLGEPLPRGLVASRRAAHDAARRAPPPEVIGAVDEALLRDPRVASLLGHRGAEDAPLRGLGASPGVARGRVRVVAGEEDVDALRPGEILVVAALLPTWTPAMQRAAGIVTETGGLLSHGAMVARELGVPAVVGVPGATRRLRSGEEVRIDGASGEVATEKRSAFST